MWDLYFLPKTSAEWAAWFQALGSIAAIFAAFIIANRQHVLAFHRDEDAKKRRQDQAAQQCIAFGARLVETISGLKENCEKQNLPRLKREDSRLREVIEFGRAIDLAEVPANAVSAFLTLRAIAAETVGIAGEYIHRGSTGSPDWTIAQFGQLLESASKAQSELVAAIKASPSRVP